MASSRNLVTGVLGAGGGLGFVAVVLLVKLTPDPPKPPPTADEIRMSTFRAKVAELHRRVGRPSTLGDAVAAIGPYTRCGPPPRRASSGPPATLTSLAQWDLADDGRLLPPADLRSLYGNAVSVFVDGSCDPKSKVTEIRGGDD